VVAPRQNLTLALIDELLADQARLQTPVARFADAHAIGSIAQLSALRSQLIPLTAPRPGEQYAFEVDLDACTGCKACVSACHSLNGLDDGETWRDTGLLASTDARHPFTQTITTACHHCADPACLNGCPVLAYEKDPLTGIVRHLDDQCIGCSYCVLMCPYDVPKYNEARGIVRKCDMCHGRLSEGEAPACVQACPTHAICIVTVTTHVRGELRADTSAFLTAAPDPSHTLPTTRYVSKRTIPENALAADAAVLRPQPPHWPLVFLLTLVPMAVGSSVSAVLSSSPVVTYYVTNLAWLAGAAGLGASVCHLGQPVRAWRVFLGWRKSWLSREALVLGVWFALLSLAAAWRFAFGGPHAAFQIATAIAGVAGLFCSVMVYADTHREFWRFANTAPRFFGSAVVLGLASAFAAPGAPPALGFVLAAATIAKLVLEARALDPLNGDRDTLTPELKTARLLTGPLRSTNELRVAAAVFGGVVVPLLIATSPAPGVLAWVALPCMLLGELAERYLFFRAVVAPKMPGVNHT
jgi:formate dehydrogenase iron-sulfur subunit